MAVDEKAHRLLLINRETAAISGIVDVISFDESEVLLAMNEGSLSVKGKELHVNRLSLEKGEVELSGRVDSMIYSDSGGAKKAGETFLARLFG